MNQLGRIRIFAGLVLLALNLYSVNVAHSEQPYSKSAELLCDKAKVIVTTSCSDDSSPVYPRCQSQTFGFTNLETGKVVTTGSKQAVTANVYGVKVIDGLAESWACLKGKDNSYLVVRYYNGGNCDECEWIEIYDLDGRNLTPNSRKNHSVFGEKLGNLCLPENWKEALISIPLRRRDK